jgi:cation diffusion facilitator CzcD-associated flavoprotein CzcO
LNKDETSRRFDVVVIGAGQAGLAIGYFLARQRRRFIILEAADSVGSAWRGRWDSLRLFTPRRYDGLPGFAFPGDPAGYPVLLDVPGAQGARHALVRLRAPSPDTWKPVVCTRES